MKTRLAYSTDANTMAAPKALAAEMERKTKGARIRLEKRGSGRVVTVIADMPGTPLEIEAITKLLKTRCGTGGSVKDLEIELQGDKRDAVQVVLREKRIPHKLAGG
ncbi:MAG: stress response translation initiation inhibitor YciH [Vicinamibacteria bacterium]